MSEDGRWVVFFSAEQNPDDNNNNNDNKLNGDVFLYDRLTGTTKVLTDDAHIPLASRPSGELFSGFSISGDGSTSCSGANIRLSTLSRRPGSTMSVIFTSTTVRPIWCTCLINQATHTPFTVNDEPRIAGGQIVFASTDFGNQSAPPTRHIYVTDLAGHIQTDIQPGTVGIIEPSDPNARINRRPNSSRLTSAAMAAT